MRGHLNYDKLPLCYVGLVEGYPIGMVCLRKHDLEIADKKMTPWLASLYIIPSQRKLGYGSKLLSHAEIKAKDMNFNKVYLFTIDPTLPSWYASRGYTTIEKLTYKGYITTTMSKTV